MDDDDAPIVQYWCSDHGGFVWPWDLHIDHDDNVWNVCIGCAAMDDIPATTWPG